MKSKIIQISTAGIEYTANTQCSHIITALCEDGSVWISRDFNSWEMFEEGQHND